MENNWLTNPSKKHMAIFGTVGIGSTVLLIVSMTNFFTESPFQRRYIVLYLLIANNIIFLVRMFYNYRRRQGGR